MSVHDDKDKRFCVAVDGGGGARDFHACQCAGSDRERACRGTSVTICQWPEIIWRAFAGGFEMSDGEVIFIIDDERWKFGIEGRLGEEISIRDCVATTVRPVAGVEGHFVAVDDGALLGFKHGAIDRGGEMFASGHDADGLQSGLPRRRWGGFDLGTHDFHVNGRIGEINFQNMNM